ncbi:MAG: hypothetical protein DBX55_02165 [Verrucomicrobia bacterium]|nr:MAG: hypothetical protein DBX55_02165 [Verrucomicrobiota bacterium]
MFAWGAGGISRRVTACGATNPPRLFLPRIARGRFVALCFERMLTRKIAARMQTFCGIFFERACLILTWL